MIRLKLLLHQRSFASPRPESQAIAAASARTRRAAPCSGRRWASGRGRDAFRRTGRRRRCAIAARASGSTIARLPPVAPPRPPGSCTLCVASKTTGTPSACICGNRPHVVHQPAVAEKRAALARAGRRWQPAAASLLDDVPHVARGHELALLHVHGPARSRGRHSRSVCRARNAGICSSAHTCADRARPACDSWMSVVTGKPGRFARPAAGFAALRPTPARGTIRGSCDSPCRTTP